MPKRKRYTGTKRRSRAAYKKSYRKMRSRKAKFYNKNWVKSGLMSIENKFFDASRGVTTINVVTDCSSSEYDPTTLNCLNAPTQGTGASNREGDFYRIHSVSVSGQIQVAAQADQSAADVSPFVRVYLVQDKFTNATQLSSEDVFVNPGASAALASNPMRVIKNEQRFKILDTALVQIVPPTMSYDGTNVEQSGQSQPFYLSYVWPRGLKVSCIANGGTMADIRDNSLHIIAFSNSSGLPAQIAYNSRIRFSG